MIETIAELLKNKKWDLLIIIALLGSLFVAVPMAINYTVGVAIDTTMATQLEPLAKDVKCLYDMEIDQVKGSAIAGYRKFESYNTKESLFPAMDKSAQNTESIRRALNYSESKILLVQLSPQKTKLFELYFDGEAS